MPQSTKDSKGGKTHPQKDTHAKGGVSDKAAAKKSSACNASCSVYSGGATCSPRRFLRCARRASSSWMPAESSITMRASTRVAAVVMMRQQQCVDTGRVETEWFDIAALDLVAALEHATVDQHSTVVAGDQVAGTGDLLGGAVAAVDDHAGFALDCAVDRTVT